MVKGVVKQEDKKLIKQNAIKAVKDAKGNPSKLNKIREICARHFPDDQVDQIMGGVVPPSLPPPLIKKCDDCGVAAPEKASSAPPKYEKLDVKEERPSRREESKKLGVIAIDVEGWTGKSQYKSVTIGGRTYSSSEIKTILENHDPFNGTISFAKSVVCAKLNENAGVSIPSTVKETMESVDKFLSGIVLPPISEVFFPRAMIANFCATLDYFNSGMFTDDCNLNQDQTFFYY